MRRTILVCLLIAGATLAAYWPAMRYEFVDLDDLYNVKHNPSVTNGLSINAVHWAFTTDYADYWHPLTWISFMIDAELWRATNDVASSEIDEQTWNSLARIGHTTNISLHAINSMLVLCVFSAMTGAFWRSAVVAGWFALHPTHVESVAWITERKDVLSMTFWLLTMWAYTRAVPSSEFRVPTPQTQHSALRTRHSTLWFIVTAAFLALGLMSKPIVVTLPCVLMLLDIWPLRRIAWPANMSELPRFLGDVRDMFIEKIPYFALAAISAYITFLHGSRSMWTVPLATRLINAITAYVRYIEKTFWPVDLCVYYPYPGMLGQPPWSMITVVLCAVLLAGVTLAALLCARRAGYFFTGWFWFIGTLVPVIGLVQVSYQSMADRFAYFPHLGLFMLIAWLVAETDSRWKVPAAMTGALALASILACGMLTSRQVTTWRDSQTLYQHALNTCPRNWKVHHYFGDYLYYQQQLDSSLEQYLLAIELHPDDANAHYKAGVVLRDLQRFNDAAARLEQSVKLDPDVGDARFNLAFVLNKLGRNAEARPHLKEAMRLQPDQRERNDALAAEIERGSSLP